MNICKRARTVMGMIEEKMETVSSEMEKTAHSAIKMVTKKS